jgi:hypothetical protein
MRLRLRNQFVRRVIFRSDLLDARIDRDMRPCIVVAPTPVARNVAGEHTQHPCRIRGLTDEKPGLRQAQEAQECFLNTIQGIFVPYTFPSHHPGQSCPVGVHERNFGVGYGLTPASDRWVIKTIIGYAFPIPGHSAHASESATAGPVNPMSRSAMRSAKP